MGTVAEPTEVAQQLKEAPQQQQRRAPLKGHRGFVRTNPRTDRFGVQRFAHVEFWCTDATNTFKRFQLGLGMSLVAKSDHSTGNAHFASYVLASHDLVFAFTAPYPAAAAAVTGSGSTDTGDAAPLVAAYSRDVANDFVLKHGLAVRAVGIVVDDAAEAYRVSVAHGAVGVLEPTTLRGADGGASASASASAPAQVVAEVRLYGDVVLRYISGDCQVPFLQGYAAVTDAPRISYGLQRLDHAVGNVPELIEVVDYISRFTGFHDFAEFVAEDVGTVDSGLNSLVLASNNEMVLLPVNEPTFNTPRKSQIQTYLEQNLGPGLQHLALKTDDIFATLREMRRHSHVGGFDFMPQPSDKYYRELPAKIGDALTAAQYEELQQLGLLADRDDQGVLLQIFTKPVGDRPTIFLEIIQRIGCMYEVPNEAAAAAAAEAAEAANGATKLEQAGGCGGFGKGNFTELFKSIEDYERTLKI